MIKNIIFDFGAVLIPLDESKTWTAFRELGAREELRDQKEIFHNYETGKLSTSQFLKKVQPYFFRKKIFPNDIGHAWSARLFTRLPEENVALLKRLHGKYRLFLLSNTNELDIKKIKQDAGPFLYRQFIRQFDKIYLSKDTGLCKPDARAFENILTENDLQAEETFYVDDGKKHIESAKKLGIKTWHFDPHQDQISDLGKVLSKLH